MNPSIRGGKRNNRQAAWGGDVGHYDTFSGCVEFFHTIVHKCDCLGGSIRTASPSEPDYPAGVLCQLLELRHNQNIVNPFNIVFGSRGYELDAEGKVPAHVLLRYMEHLRWEYTRRDLRELVALFRQGHTFVVVSQALRVYRDIGLAIPIRGNLWIGRTGRSSIVFHHTFHHADDGELFAAGSTVAVFLAPDTVPTRLPDILEEPDTDPPMMPDLTPPGFTEIPPAPFERSYRVRASDLDLQRHMNQANYAALYDDTRQAAANRNVYGSGGAGMGRVRFLHIEYVHPATAGEKLVVATWPIEGKPLSLGFAMRRNDTLISRAVIQTGSS